MSFWSLCSLIPADPLMSGSWVEGHEVTPSSIAAVGAFGAVSYSRMDNLIPGRSRFSLRLHVGGLLPGLSFVHSCTVILLPVPYSGRQG